MDVMPLLTSITLAEDNANREKRKGQAGKTCLEQYMAPSSIIRTKNRPCILEVVERFTFGPTATATFIEMLVSEGLVAHAITTESMTLTDCSNCLVQSGSSRAIRMDPTRYQL
ncbi:unnamed protein product [Cercospora beticola]|nr:unnamed protein product [Cercospora beticola]